MKLGSLCFQNKIHPLVGSQSKCNFQAQRSSGHLFEWTHCWSAQGRGRAKGPRFNLIFFFPGEAQGWILVQPSPA